MRALKDLDPRAGQDLGELVRSVHVQVVVPQHRDDRRLHAATGLREHLGLLGLAVGRQVAREQDDVGGSLDRLEGREDGVAILGGAVHVAGGGHANARVTAEIRCQNAGRPLHDP